MLGAAFVRYELRSRDVDAARSFYTHVFGEQLWSAEISVSLLPEQAAARGAPAHWLGHLSAPDVTAALARIVARGGQQLGPVRPVATGGALAVVRDPFGAVFAVSSNSPGVTSGSAAHPSAVSWRTLHVVDVDAALGWYSELFGWAPKEEVVWGGALGRQRAFAWTDGAAAVGTIADTARMPQVHPHWMYCFEAADLDAQLALVRKHGGTTLGPIRLPDGTSVAPCEDAGRAAFALYARDR